MKRKKQLKKGFTLIELMIVIAIIGILGTLIIPKVMLAMKKTVVAKVQGYRYESQNLILVSLKLPDLTSQPINPSLLEHYAIKETPQFTYNGIHYDKTNQIVDTRTNTGGWIYDSIEGKLYVNLPNGAYTGDTEYERWDGEGSKYVITPKSLTSTGLTTSTNPTKTPSGVKPVGITKGGGVVATPQTSQPSSSKPIPPVVTVAQKQQQLLAKTPEVILDNHLMNAFFGGDGQHIRQGKVTINPQSRVQLSQGSSDVSLKTIKMVYLNGNVIATDLLPGSHQLDIPEAKRGDKLTIILEFEGGKVVKGVTTLTDQ